jgi:hypothetical protein
MLFIVSYVTISKLLILIYQPNTRSQNNMFNMCAVMSLKMPHGVPKETN